MLTGFRLFTSDNEFSSLKVYRPPRAFPSSCECKSFGCVNAFAAGETLPLSEESSSHRVAEKKGCSSLPQLMFSGRNVNVCSKRCLVESQIPVPTLMMAHSLFAAAPGLLFLFQVNFFEKKFPMDRSLRPSRLLRLRRAATLPRSTRKHQEPVM